MKIQQLLFKILKKTKRYGRTDACTRTRTHGQRENSIPTINQVCGGYNNLTKPTVARKLAVGHLCVGQLVFWLLVISSFNYFKMHAWSTSMLLLLHSAFMLSVVKMLLKGEVGDHALNRHGNYILHHGKSWKNHGILFLNFCGNPGLFMRTNGKCNNSNLP